MNYLGYRPEHDASKLTIELVPATAWWSNVRSNVPRKDWETCKTFVRERSRGKCEICGGVGSRHPIECHEEWAYDDDEYIQTLVGLIALCPDCHAVKHFSRSVEVGNADRVTQHLAKINGWPISRAIQYATLQSKIWQVRSQFQWELDVTFLSLLNIDVRVSDRG